MTSLWTTYNPGQKRFRALAFVLTFLHGSCDKPTIYTHRNSLRKIFPCSPWTMLKSFDCRIFVTHPWLLKTNIVQGERGDTLKCSVCWKMSKCLHYAPILQLHDGRDCKYLVSLGPRGHGIFNNLYLFRHSSNWKAIPWMTVLWLVAAGKCSLAVNIAIAAPPVSRAS